MKIQEFVVESYSNKVSLDEYKKITKSGLWKEENELFEKYIRDRGTLLDLGCGTGRAAYNIKQKVEIYACDLVPAMIEEAKNLSKYFTNKPIFSVQDACSLNYPNFKFDYIVFAYNGINTVPGKLNRKKILTEVARTLKPKGLFIFASHERHVMNKPLLWIKRYFQVITKTSKFIKEFGDNIHYKYGREQYINIPSMKELKELVINNGFEIIEIVKTNSDSENGSSTLPPRNTNIFVCRKV
jgi:ubiquinone/menaquinone biosynthesis C-methylase UbiE